MFLCSSLKSSGQHCTTKSLKYRGSNCKKASIWVTVLALKKLFLNDWSRELIAFKIQIITHQSFLVLNYLLSASRTLGCPSILFCFVLSCSSFLSLGPRGCIGSIKPSSWAWGNKAQCLVDQPSFRSWHVSNDLKWLHLFSQVITSSIKREPHAEQNHHGILRVPHEAAGSSNWHLSAPPLSTTR